MIDMLSKYDHQSGKGGRILRYPPLAPTDTEIQSFFCDLKDVVDNKITLLGERTRNILIQRSGMIREDIKDYKAKKLNDENLYVFLGALIAHQERELDCIRRWAYYWQRIYKRTKLIKGEVTQEDIANDLDVDSAREIPIDTLVDGEIRWNRGRAVVLCPLHDERTPSMTLYQDSNSYYCFGCQSGGDVITLYEKINNCDFKTAVSELLKI